VSEGAEIRLLPDAEHSAVSPAGPLRSAQEAELAVEPGLLERIWRPELPELLGRAYWRFLERRSRGLLRVRYGPASRSILLAGRPRLELLRFRPPRYGRGPGFARVSWGIERGLLVGREGRGRGELQLEIRRIGQDGAGRELLRIRSSVSSYYPLLRGRGRFARLGALLYAQTQGRFHSAVTRGFLRSLVALDLPQLREGRRPPYED
jgi:hypothetical protein